MAEFTPITWEGQIATTTNNFTDKVKRCAHSMVDVLPDGRHSIFFVGGSSISHLRIDRDTDPSELGVWNPKEKSWIELAREDIKSHEHFEGSVTVEFHPIGTILEDRLEITITCKDIGGKEFFEGLVDEIQATWPTEGRPNPTSGQHLARSVPLPQPTARKPCIFLSYARVDQAQVEQLYQRLAAAGFDPWMDTKNILPGEPWKPTVKKAIRNSDFFLACLSKSSVNKRGVLQEEIKEALDVWQGMLDNDIYLIPVRLEACEAPDSLKVFQWVNLFDEAGWSLLVKAIQQGAEVRGIVPPAPSRQPFEPEMILIPAGEFLMGSDKKLDSMTNDDELPQHKLCLPDYYIAKTPITNAQYLVFLRGTGERWPDGWIRIWKDSIPPQGKENHPAVQIDWYESQAYCRWLSEVTGKLYRLPTEAEWEKAARGMDGRIWPWGDAWDATRCNTREGGPNDTTAVGNYPQGASPYGVLDMAGNVWEWTSSLHKPFPHDQKLREVRVVRGGAWYGNLDSARCAARDGDYPNSMSGDCGFRVISPIVPGS